MFVNNLGTVAEVQQIWVNDNGVVSEVKTAYVNDNITLQKWWGSSQQPAPTMVMIAEQYIGGDDPSGYNPFTPQGSMAPTDLNGSDVYNVTTRGTNTALDIIITGVHPKDFWTSVTINGPGWDNVVFESATSVYFDTGDSQYTWFGIPNPYFTDGGSYTIDFQYPL